MKNLILVSIAVCFIGIGGLGFSTPSAADESEAAANPTSAVTELRLETLLSAQLEGVEGTDVIVSRVTMPPNAELPRHWHPGEEFAYVLSGSTMLRLEGEPDQVFGPGDIAKVPLKRVHSASAGDEGATILVFRIHERGQPERVPVE